MVEEDDYFDRDYLAEFAAFYGVSSRGYPNRCRRLHFFSDVINRDHVRAAAGGSSRARARLQDNYLGFVVQRPIPASPLGRTVLRAYPDQTPGTPRYTSPFRQYQTHIAGITLTVTGLAWQQQDTGVGACATVALWSALHSSAFDDHHAIPTTADITRNAHKTASLGNRVFPSRGLTIGQLCEAVKEANLAPVVLQGDVRTPTPNGVGISRARFGAACASLLRSGYPVMLLGYLEDVGMHAICAVGFREVAGATPDPDTVDLQDQGIQFIYIHDDNLGPAVRFEVTTDPTGDFVRLRASAPPRRHALAIGPDPTSSYHDFIPSQIVAAVHEDVRTSPDKLLEVGLLVASRLCNYTNWLVGRGQLAGTPIGLTLGTRFVRLDDYMDTGLANTVAGRPQLTRVRMALQERVQPMSLHVAVVRVGWGGTPLIDILYDTTDSEKSMYPFCAVLFDSAFANIALQMQTNGWIDLGEFVPAF